MSLATAAGLCGLESSPAIAKLGPLFRVTEVHLWDDETGRKIDMPGVRKNQHIYFVSDDEFDENTLAEPSASTSAETARPSSHVQEDHFLEQDLGIVHQMSALGLPVSFSTSKKKISGSGRKKRGLSTTSVLGGNSVTAYANKSADVRKCEKDSASAIPNELASASQITEVHRQVLFDNNDESFGMSNLSVEEGENSSGDVNFNLKDKFVNMGGSLYTAHVINDSLEHCDLKENDSYAHSEVRLQISETAVSSGASQELVCSLMVEQSMSPVELSTSDFQIQSSELGLNHEYGDWKVIWDIYYERYYFYNKRTEESSWYPPPGLENYYYSVSAYDTKDEMQELEEKCFRTCDQPSEDNTDIIDNVKVSVLEDGQIDEMRKSSCMTEEQASEEVHVTEFFSMEKEVIDDDSCVASDVFFEDQMLQISSGLVPELCGASEKDSSEGCGVTFTERKKRIRRSRSYTKTKYWNQRYSLFSRFDYGIKMDEEGWFSVTPELIAIHHASRCGHGTMIDCFAGVGGNSIQFAMKCTHVIGVDIDPQKISYAQHNAAIYGVHDKIDFVVSDIFQIASHLKAETAFLSPPWGGPEYAKAEVYDIMTMLKPCDGYSLFKLATSIAPRVVMFLPRNVDPNQLAELALSADPPFTLEVEKNFLSGRLKAITAYFEAQ